MHQVRVGRLEDVDAAGAAGNSHVLLAVVLPGDRLSDNSGWRLELPDDLAGVAVHRDELARELASEDKAAVGDKGAGPVGALERRFPFGLSGQWIDRAQVPADSVGTEDGGDLHGAMGVAGLEIPDLLDRIGLVIS